MIPFNRAGALGRERELMAEALARGPIMGDGPFGKRCEALLETETGARRALLTTSCTHALEMAALLLDIRPGDEVVVPSFTFVSAANAFVLRGATPVFAEIRGDTLNLDERLLPPLLTERTRAVVAVHYGGVACEMDTILAAAGKAGVPVVEDAAHALFGGYRGRPLGTLGALGALSFHETKNFSCGEGGALLLNDGSFVARAEILREKGTDRSRFWRGEVDKYTWRDVGSSWVLSDLSAAFLLGQLEQHERVQARRRTLWERYRAALADWAARHGVSLPHIPGDCAPAWHLFHLLLPDAAARAAFLAHMHAGGIAAVFHYLPLHTSPMGARFGGRAGSLPVTESVAARIARLPFYTLMTDDEQDRVIARVLDFAP